MTVRTRINELCASRGITTAYQLQKLTGLHPTPANNLFNDKVSRLHLDTLDLLCKAFNVAPGELIVFENDERTNK